MYFNTFTRYGHNLKRKVVFIRTTADDIEYKSEEEKTQWNDNNYLICFKTISMNCTLTTNITALNCTIFRIGVHIQFIFSNEKKNINYSEARLYSSFLYDESRIWYDQCKEIFSTKWEFLNANEASQNKCLKFDDTRLPLFSRFEMIARNRECEKQKQIYNWSESSYLSM